jgi:hypothetical protein
MNDLQSFDEQLLRLVWEIEKHFNGYIDAYLGPEALKQSTLDAPLREPEALLDDVQKLRDAIPSESVERAHYLTAVLRAIETTVRMLTGEAIPYLEEVTASYDILPQMVDEAVFTQALSTLDALLPGIGPIAERLETRNAHYYVPREKLLELLELARAETQRRTRALYDLPDDESVIIELTNNQPWGAYNWYLGHGRSLIELNTDLPTSGLTLLHTFAHEGYPGHHTEAVLKEQRFWSEKGYGESAVALLHSPSAVIAEGIATTAVEIIFPNQSYIDWTVDVILPAAGIRPVETAEEIRAVEEAIRARRYITGNAAIAYHGGRLNRAETIDYLQTYGALSPQRAAKSFEFITAPLSRSYVFTYTSGYDLIAGAAGVGPKDAVFKRCLTELILPSELANLA